MSTLQPNAQNQTTAATDATTQLIRRVRQATRKRYTAEEKIRIVMEGIRGVRLRRADGRHRCGSAIPGGLYEACRREGIHANMYYKWLKSFMEAGKERLKGEEKRGATHAEVDELKRDNERLKQLVADLSVDNMVLKKSLL